MSPTSYPADVLVWADRIGVTLSVVGDRLRYTPLEAASPEFVATLIQHKPALLALLIEPETSAEAIADSVDACIRLGKRLRDGEFRSLRCGITGRECWHCKGVPCAGSEPFTASGGQGVAQEVDHP